MLALRRSPGERLNFYRKTESGMEPMGYMMLVDMKPCRVTLGFEFPSDIVMVRDEIDEHKQAAKLEVHP